MTAALRRLDPAKLRARREAAGYSRHTLASLAGVPYPSLCDYEEGVCTTTTPVVVRLAAALRLPVDDLTSSPEAGQP